VKNFNFFFNVSCHKSIDYVICKEITHNPLHIYYRNDHKVER